jgi:hypothetical protein
MISEVVRKKRKLVFCSLGIFFNLHFRSLSKVSQRGEGIVSGFKKFGEKAKDVIQSIARGVEKYAPTIEKGLNILGEVSPETVGKYGPGIKKALGTAVKLAPLLL